MPWLFTTSADGNLATHVGDDPGKVREHRLALNSRIGLPISWMDQVHGDHVAIVELGSLPDEPCDSQISGDVGLALGVLVADCIPLLLEASPCVAAVHVGRRGLANEVAIKTVKLMREHFGAREVRAILGPSICGACYEVPQAMHDEIAWKWPRSSARTQRGTPALDLPAGLVEQLASVDVVAQVDARCTREDLTLSSHRRDPDSGRIAGVIWR